MSTQMQQSDQQPYDGGDQFQAERITQPSPVLLRYYIVCSLGLGPLFPFALIPLVCKYLTLRYRFDESGIAMKWGVLFRREIYLTYRRIQDIHLTRNLIQRWFGLASLAVQTASGSATPEMSIEGILEAEPLRDHLYQMMRGAKNPEQGDAESESGHDESLSLLREIRDSMQTLAARANPNEGADSRD